MVQNILHNLCRKDMSFSVLMFLGFGLGLLWYAFFWTREMQESSFFSFYTLFAVKQATVDIKRLFARILLIHMTELGIYIFLCATFVGKWVSLMGPVETGFLMAVIQSVLFGRFGGKGIWLMAVIILPQWFFYLKGYNILFRIGRRVATKKMLPLSENLKSGASLSVGLKLIGLFFLGSAAEALCSPYLLNWALMYL